MPEGRSSMQPEWRSKVKNCATKFLRPVLYERIRIRFLQEQHHLQRRIEETEEELLKHRAVDGTSLIDGDGQDLMLRCQQYRLRLKLVLRGLQQIWDGTFGLCARCNEPISVKRLDAIPTARYCIKCQGELEHPAGAPKFAFT